MPFILDPNWLLVSLLISGIGTVLFLYGKKEARLPHLLTGAIFFVYPYFTPNLLIMIVLAIILLTGLWYVTRLGW